MALVVEEVKPIKKQIQRKRRDYLIRGPLGIWPFPILNFLLLISLRRREAYFESPNPDPPRPLRREIIRDERGRIIEETYTWL